jgi:hypothetical protein
LVAGAVVLVILAAIDAAYSGDWSRIGVISKDVELGLRPLLALLGVFHIFCGGVAAIAASKKGYNPVPPTLKVQTASPLCCISGYLALRLDSASVWCRAVYEIDERVFNLLLWTWMQVLAVGFLALVEVLLKDPADPTKAWLPHLTKCRAISVSDVGFFDKKNLSQT